MRPQSEENWDSQERNGDEATYKTRFKSSLLSKKNKIGTSKRGSFTVLRSLFDFDEKP